MSNETTSRETSDMDVLVTNFPRHLHCPRRLPERGIRISLRGKDGALLYPSDPYEARRAREKTSFEEWEQRLRVWLSSAVSLASDGYPFFDPPAPDGTPENWRWANWDAYDDEEALNVALVRTYGCRCTFPLLGWTMEREGIGWVPTTPRCRTCNADEN